MIGAFVLLADLWIAGGTVVSSGKAVQQALHVRDGRIAAVAAHPPDGGRVLDATGLWLVPAVVDAHVHLPVAGEIAKVAKAELDAGVAAVLDLGTPERLLGSLASDTAPLRVAFSGPLLTAPKGYPTQTWGRDGYGGELATAADARAAVERLAKAGARFIKLAFDARHAVLDPAVAKAVVAAAHAKGLKTAAHALDAAMVQRALDAGVDVLGHAPVEALPEKLVAEIGRRRLHVVSTLKAFGSGEPAIENVRRLRAAGARIVYGTDLGNTGTAPGIDRRELALLGQAGLSAADVLRAATSDGAALLGLDGLGALEPGKAASFLALRADPLADPAALADPAWVVIDGVRR